MVIKSFQMPIGNGHWESNFFNGYFSPIVLEIDISMFLFTALVRVPVRACEEVASELRLGSGFAELLVSLTT